MKDHLVLVSHVKKLETPDGFDWSVKEWQKLKAGDAFVLLQVGTDNDGVAMLGRFSSDPYEDKSWRNDGGKVHYADLEIFDAFNLEKEKDFPEIKWHGGYSGELLEEDAARRAGL